MTATEHTSATPATPPWLRRIEPGDHPAIHRLQAGYFRDTLPFEDWQRLVTGNPVLPGLGDTWPAGWVLEDDAATVVGAFLNIPTRYHFRGAELLCANGHGWAVAPEHRAYAPLLMDEYFSQQRPDLFVNTTVGVVATPVVSSYSEPVPATDLQTRAFRVIRHRSFARTALAMRSVPLAPLAAVPLAAALWARDRIVARPPRRSAAPALVVPRDTFGPEFDGFWARLVERYPDRLLGVRDRATLCWHFQGALRLGRLRILTAERDGGMVGYCVLKRQHYGDPGLTSMRLVDYQTLDEGGGDVLPDLLRAATDLCRAERVDCLEHLGLGIPKMRALDRYARGRSRKERWPFYYRANDPGLAAELRDPAVWDPSEYDGDATCALA
jgi:hypothetical protein